MERQYAPAPFCGFTPSVSGILFLMLTKQLVQANRKLIGYIYTTKFAKVTILKTAAGLSQQVTMPVRQAQQKTLRFEGGAKRNSVRAGAV